MYICTNYELTLLCLIKIKYLISHLVGEMFIYCQTTWIRLRRPVNALWLRLQLCSGLTRIKSM